MATILHHFRIMAMETICPTLQVHAGRHLKLQRSRAILIGFLMFALTIYFIMALISYYVGFEPCRHTIQQQLAESNYNIQRQLENQTAFGGGPKCAGRLIYIYDLPRQFNTDLVKHCNGTNAWPHMCEDLSNEGFGQQIIATNESRLPVNSILLPADAWHITSQFSLEVLFHERLKQYECLTNNPNEAVFAYIPFYTALDLTKTLFMGTVAVKDKLSQRLMGWLESNPHWKASHGHNHVLVLGRIVWDYTRKEEDGAGWGNALLSFPELKNTTKLSIERDPRAPNQMAVPYPTSWHPYADEHIRVWQETVKTSKRETLVLYAGASRGNNQLRDELFKQCDQEPDANCTLLPCSGGVDTINCARQQDVLLEKFLKAVFCLQPPGDSVTRKGVFDCLIAGSIPVFFDAWTAHSQYQWHLPSNGTSYSVILPRDETAQGTLNVITELAQIPPENVIRMQETIQELLPNIMYKKPGSSIRTKDAFDLAIDNLLERFRLAATG